MKVTALHALVAAIDEGSLRGAATSLSSSRNVFEIAGWDRPSSRAAPRRLPSSMAATSACRAVTFMMDPDDNQMASRLRSRYLLRR
jgi:hypothetical protein